MNETNNTSIPPSTSPSIGEKMLSRLRCLATNSEELESRYIDKLAIIMRSPPPADPNLDDVPKELLPPYFEELRIQMDRIEQALRNLENILDQVAF